MEAAVRLRVRAVSWKRIAEVLQMRTPRSARELMDAHRDLWDRMMAVALRALVFNEIEPEALHAQREYMRRGLVPEAGKDAQYVGQRAAYGLLAHVVKARGELIKIEAELSAKRGARTRTKR